MQCACAPRRPPTSRPSRLRPRAATRRPRCSRSSTSAATRATARRRRRQGGAAAPAVAPRPRRARRARRRPRRRRPRRGRARRAGGGRARGGRGRGGRGRGRGRRGRAGADGPTSGGAGSNDPRARHSRAAAHTRSSTCTGARFTPRQPPFPPLPRPRPTHAHTTPSSRPPPPRAACRAVSAAPYPRAPRPFSPFLSIGLDAAYCWHTQDRAENATSPPPRFPRLSRHPSRKGPRARRGTARRCSAVVRLRCGCSAACCSAPTAAGAAARRGTLQIA